MVATLSGIGLGFLALGFLFQTYARPIDGLTTLSLVFIVYLGRMRFLWRLPGSSEGYTEAGRGYRQSGPKRDAKVPLYLVARRLTATAR